MNGFLSVFLGAGIGGMLRHGVSLAALRLFGSAFPYGTFAVNIFGSFVMGLLVGFFALRLDPGHAWRLFLTTGLLGGFTTFSTFSLDTAVMIERGQLWLAAAYVAGSVVIAIVGLFLGMALLRHAG